MVLCAKTILFYKLLYKIKQLFPYTVNRPNTMYNFIFL